jgi:5-methylcytosine-specific restriction endonuclease McrA
VHRKALETSNPPRAQRKLAGSVVARDRGICHICGQPGADTDHHLMAKRDGGADHPANLCAVHRGCHNSAHRRRGRGD